MPQQLKQCGRRFNTLTAIHRMHRKIFFFFFAVAGLNYTLRAQTPAYPFPQHVKYYPGTIRPHVRQNVLDAETESFYSSWKKRFVRTEPGTIESYIWFEGKGGKQCVSEGQGYGMVITALMAGFDRDAHRVYDNLYRYYHAHPTHRSHYLMAWAQRNNGRDVDMTSAADGDIDIAYSLILADRQWGSKGAINYRQAAKNMINAIMQYEINPKTWTVIMCDGIEHDSRDYFDTRSSDFMPSHFKAFEAFTHDSRWQKVIDAEYRLFISMQNRFSPDAGLIPDFIVDLNTTPKPAPRHFLESKYDGEYNYNACRDPWRIATDYLLTGDIRSKHLVSRINRWVKSTTDSDTYNLSAGYTLAGDDIKGRYFEALSFIAPFGVSAMVDGRNGIWLDKVWKYLLGFKMKDFDYYDNTIKLWDMIVISGNYWKPY